MAEKKPPEWEVDKLRTKGKGRTYPYLVPEVKNVGDGTAHNVEIYGHAISQDGENPVPSKNKEEIEKVFPGNSASVKTKIDNNTDAIRVTIDSDGEDRWQTTINPDYYEVEDWMEKKLGRM